MPIEPPTLTRRSFLSAAAAGIVSSPIWAKSITARVSDSQLLSDIEHRTFYFYWERANHSNGLMADRWSTPAACSITGTGFALTAWPIGVERGWITRNQARDITLRTLRFFEQLPQGEQRSGTAGYRGFYYHLIDMETGLRLPNWELSTIDTCWLQMGMTFAQGWFDQEDEKEKEIRALAQRLLDRTEWDWMQANSTGGKASATFEEVYDNSFHYLIWNDQFYDDPEINGCSESCSGPWGHSKGFSGGVGKGPGEGYLNVGGNTNITTGVDNVSATTWWDSGLSPKNCNGVDKLIKAANAWPNGKIPYHYYGPNSNTAANELGAAGGFRPPKPPGAFAWWGWVF